MKKLVMLAIVVVMVFAMATPMTRTSAQDKIKIVYSHAFGDEKRQGIIQDYADAFMAENPNVEVELRVASSYRDNLNSALLASEQGEAPHIVQIFEVGTQLALDTGIFVPISSVASQDQLDSLADVIQPVLNYYTVGEDRWSVPFNSSSAILYYNQDMFDKAGIDAAPQTYSDVIADCEILMNADLGLQGCIGWPMHSWMVEQWMSEQNALLVNNENGRDGRATESYLDSDAMKTIFNWWKELADKGYYNYTGQLEDWNGSDAIFTGQQGAMHITSTADLRNIISAGEEAGFTVGAAMLPIPDGVERNGVVIGGASNWLTADHPEEELKAAADFMLFIGNTENMVTWHKGTGYYPIRYSSIQVLEDEGWFTEDPRFSVAFDQLTQTQVNPASGGALLGTFLETRTIIEQAAQSVVDGGESVDSALQTAKEAADQAISDYNDLVAD